MQSYGSQSTFWYEMIGVDSSQIKHNQDDNKFEFWYDLGILSDIDLKILVWWQDVFL